MKKKLLASILVITFILINICGTSLATTQADIDKLKKEKTEKQNELNQITTEKKSVQDEIGDLRSQIDSLQAELYDLQSKLDGLNSSIKSKGDEITKKQAELEEKKELLKKRLVVMYKKGGMSYLDVLVGSGNLFEMLVNFDAVQEVTEADNDLINKVTQEKQDLENAKTELENEKKQVDDVKSQKEAKNQELTDKKKEKDEKVASLSESEKAKQKEIDTTEAAINDAQAKMAKEYEEAQKRLREQQKNSSSSNSSKSNGTSSRGSSSSSSNAKGQNGVNFNGTFIWPCNNKIVTSLQSSYRALKNRRHDGIDIGARYENVYASAPGIAYSAYNPGGYGNYIIIYHGNGYATLYGHLNSIKISDGQFVSQGEVIAQSGNTGGSTGPHLHFEIRQVSSASGFFDKNSVRNPLNYLPGGYTIDE